MLKMICLVNRLGHLSHQAFEDHWRNHHAPLVLRHSHVLGIRRYVQNVPMGGMAQAALEAGRGTLPGQYDGYAELWWDDMAAHLATRSTDQGRQALGDLIEDESRFIDLTRSQMWYVQERLVI